MPDMSSESERSVLGAKFVNLVLAFGGYLSLTYVLGYAYWWAYLDVFHATFLIGQVPAIEALFSSASVLLMCGVLLANALERKLDTTETTLLRVVYFLSVFSLIVGLLDLLIGNRFRDSIRETVFGSVGISAIVVALACGKLASDAWLRREWYLTIKRSGLGLFFAFGVSPFAMGYSSGYSRSADAAAKLPSVRVTGSTQTLYLLLATDNNVYCVSEPAKGEGLVLAIPWSSVVKIEGVRAVRATKLARRRGR